MKNPSLFHVFDNFAANYLAKKKPPKTLKVFNRDFKSPRKKRQYWIVYHKNNLTTFLATVEFLYLLVFFSSLFFYVSCKNLCF